MERWLRHLPESFGEFWDRLASCLPSGAWCGLVGGGARDLADGRAPKDVDLEVLGADPEKLYQALLELWPGRVRLVGRSFAVIKISLPPLDVDLTIGPEGAFEEEAARRDFTMNSMAVELPSGRLVDPFGGLSDWHSRTLRMTRADSLASDPLRVLRGVQFAARFELRVEEGTLAEMRRLAPELAGLPKERLTEEWKKLLLRAPRPSVGLELLREIGGLPPELAALVGVPQEPRWHPEGDVWTHTWMVVDQAARLNRLDPEQGDPLVVMLGALLHDVGKASTTIVDADGKVTSHGHEGAGRRPAQHFLERLSFSAEVQEGVAACVVHHMRPNLLGKQAMSPRQRVNALRRLVRDVTPPGWATFLRVCEADRRGRGFADAETAPYGPSLELTPLLAEERIEHLAAHPLLRGRDLLDFGIPPGPVMGRWLRLVEEARDAGHLATREEALDWLRRELSYRR